MGVSLMCVGEPELPLELFPAAERRRAHWAVTAVAEGKGAGVIFFLKIYIYFPLKVFCFFYYYFFGVEEQNSLWKFSLNASSSHVVVCV